jgi:ribosomal protein S18 acetylase RimI-like enzyme
VGLLVRAHEACWRVHFPDEAELTVAGFKQAARRLDLWTSSCTVALEGNEPIGVLLAAKRERATRVWRLGVRPDRLRAGHASHLLDSLAAKLAILGPPDLVAEVPAEQPHAAALFEKAGYRREAPLTDFLLPGGAPAPPRRELVIPTTVEELLANDALHVSPAACWEREAKSLLNRREELRGIAVASPERIEAWALVDDAPGTAERRLLGFGAADPARQALWLGLLFADLAAADARPLRLPRVADKEVSFDLLSGLGLRCAGTAHRYVRRASG